MNLEIEIKLAIDDAALTLLKQHPLLQHTLQPSKQQHLLSTYFDTSDKQLRQAGYALRIRQQDNQFIQTLKGRAENHQGLSARREWEWPLPEFKINAELIPIPALQTLMATPQFCRDFRPQFMTDFIRTTWDIVLSDQTWVEIALDQGKIIADKKELALQELEFELKAGNTHTLQALAALFAAELGLKPENRSKAARGFDLMMDVN